MATASCNQADLHKSKMDPKEHDESDETTDTSCGDGHRQRLGAKDWDLALESYHTQLQIWPTRGKHILAHFDEESVVVYQAYEHSIADYAVEHQRFGGPDFNMSKISWIKTNFMLMMYQCRWAKKHNQEHVMAVRLTKPGFEQILAKAYTVKTSPLPSDMINNKVRLQWDPDHQPNGENLPRRAIQLGIRGKIFEKYCTEFILNIKDITDLVHKQHQQWTKTKTKTKGGIKDLITPRERVYLPSNPDVYPQLELDDLPTQTVDSFSSLSC